MERISSINKKFLQALLSTPDSFGWRRVNRRYRGEGKCENIMEEGDRGRKGDD